ncbi:MAG: UDP-N-acetylglucosamine 1-carboxyvinyltransferase [Oscillospiraceae bacterium]|nr:UDP-N-acetylglucosamine 1-carboxyvinyltransferase [Oscillospiraceae bacterium]
MYTEFKEPILTIEGGRRLEGEIAVQGAKNSMLPLLAATVLCKGQTVLHNCPRLTDADAAFRILDCLGCKCSREASVISVNAENINNVTVPDNLMQEMRSSIVFLGAILGRCGSCRWSTPGGCDLGPRPINYHTEAFEKMGVVIENDGGFMNCTSPKGIRGAKISLELPSVGTTENIILAAVTAKGTTEILNAAREPEVVDLATFLNKCGAKIMGAGGSTIVIEGVPELSGTQHSVIPDRIVTATYMCCAAITGGELVLTKTKHDDLSAVLPIFEKMGCLVYTYGDDRIYINARKGVVSPGRIKTHYHPGFPTDAQPLLMALTTIAPGTTVFKENIFLQRFNIVSELNRLGANINIHDNCLATVEGVSRLSGANVKATDLRGGAALVTAGLACEGVTKISRIYHIDRGYESIEDVLRGIGANIKRV